MVSMPNFIIFSQNVKLFVTKNSVLYSRCSQCFIIFLSIIPLNPGKCPVVEGKVCAFTLLNTETADIQTR